MIYNETIYNTGWNTKKLNQLGTFSRGKSTHRPRDDKRLFEDGKYPFIQTGEVKSSNLFISNHKLNYNEFGLLQSKMWKKGTLCITIAANIAETGILSYPMCFPDSIVGFNAYDEEISEIFMYYIFQYIKSSIQRSASGSIQDNINIDYLQELYFKVPDRKAQIEIEKILSNIDLKINNNIQINNNLEELIYTVYMYKFGNKKANGVIGDIIVENSKSPIKVGEAKDTTGIYPFFTSGDSILEWNEYLVDGRNMFLNTGGNADVKFYVGKAMYSTDTWCITTCKDMSDYLYLYFKSIKKELNRKFFHGSGLKHLQKPLLKEEPIYIPSREEIVDFNDAIQPMFDTISSNMIENKKLVSLRDFLLPMLMNGQINVDDIKI